MINGKPRLYCQGGVWWCRGSSRQGWALSMEAAYDNWISSHMLSIPNDPIEQYCNQADNQFNSLIRSIRDMLPRRK